VSESEARRDIPHGEERILRVTGRCCASPGEPWGPGSALILRDAACVAPQRLSWKSSVLPWAIVS